MPVKTILCFPELGTWKKFNFPKRRIWLSGPALETIDYDSIRVLGTARIGVIREWISNQEGHFAIVVCDENWTCAAVDCVRSIPIIYHYNEGILTLGQSGFDLISSVGLTCNDLSEKNLIAYKMAGFTIGENTIYENVFSLLPGEILFAKDDQLDISQYHTWSPWRAQPYSETVVSASKRLETVHEETISRLIKSADGRKIIVPISGGMDSRFILSGLVEAGYRNIASFSYGTKGNRDARIGQTISHRLNVDWEFIEYSNSLMRQLLQDKNYYSYERYADSLTGMPFLQDFFVLLNMKKNFPERDDYIFVNGNSGDFISGNHIPAAFFKDGMLQDKSFDQVIEMLILKHFKHWACYMTDSNINNIKHEIKKFILKDLDDSLIRNYSGLFEASEFLDRQSKYVINGQRAYEFFNYSWRLPLWDRSVIEFWEDIPPDLKENQKLYRKVLEISNWGGVWRDIPINRLTVRPYWLYIIRFFLKGIFLFIGRAEWHRFEKHVLAYWMDPLCSYARWGWLEIAFDKRGHHSAIGWQIEHSLNRHLQGEL